MVYPIKKILVVDDDRSLHDLCRAILTRYNYICLSAFNGDEGLEKIKEENPDLILLDWVMPGMNGLQVFEKILEDEAFLDFREIPVIMLSAVPKDEDQKNDLLNKGISAYLNKPFGLNELVNVIQNVLITNEVKLKNVKLQKEITRAKQYLERIIDHAPLGILAVDKQGKILRVNKFFTRMMGIDHPREVINRNVLDPDLVNRVEIRDHFKQAVELGESCSIPAIDIRNLAGQNIRANIQCVPLRDESGEITDVLSIWEDVTEVEKKAYELSILRQISEAMQSVLDVDILLNLILTSITAGCALGFSRAIIFMVNEKAGLLEGRMGVGPISPEAAYHIWGELAKDHSNLEAFLTRFGKKSPNQEDPFNKEIQKLRVSLDDENNILIQTIRHQKSYWIKDYNQLLAQDMSLTDEMIGFFQPEEFVTVPLISKNGVLGVVVADNKYSSVPLRNDQVSLLKLLASHAALALENAEAYRELKVKVQELAETLDVLRTTQDKLVRTEQLATIGKMAAHVAHEIRNPLTAIGGFARSIKKSPGDTDQVELGVQIIDAEVHRLEKILRSVLDFTKIPKPFLTKKQINQVVQDVVALQQPVLKEKIRLKLHLDENLPLFYFDDEQIKQALVNVLTNSLVSIPEDGEIEISTFIRDDKIVIEISDTGVGISEENLENIFNPFFTTRSGGTGLGLAVTRRILEEHDGKIEVESKLNKGSTFRLILPLLLEIKKGES